MTSPRSIRFDADVLRRLDRYVRDHPGASASSVANQFVDEALRAEEHQGVTFRQGPTGRRAALVGGPDVWEVIDTLFTARDEDPELAGDALVTATATATGLTTRQVRTAVRYFTAYRDEIDDLVTAHREAADEAEAAWRAEQELLRHAGRAS
ncbi:hypothetical protein [Pseudonocardia acaciae]|uniref:hypothetical protein n=1 Tax=Pseudonocardia acaciae TaxID=551276 RepID=UPI0004903258|nr:hypothetical protein [Pseudonocardia acaciae]